MASKRFRWFWKVKRAVARTGISPLYRLEYLSGLFRMGAWLRERRADERPYFTDRVDLYRYVIESELKSQPIDFLEFGVFKGESLQSWTKLSAHPCSRFWGFDTFRGLPESWRLPRQNYPAGIFDVKGATPDIPDSRVHYVAGLFQDTLRDFLKTYHPRGRLVVHLDADLYSSTLYVLTVLDPWLAPGTVVLLDEFASVQSEFRALVDYESSFRRKSRLIASSGRFHEQVALVIEA
jgi:O-methyltransferase